MKRIYEVDFEQKWTGCADWIRDSVSVVANGDAMPAVHKAKKWVLHQSYVGDNDKVQKCTGFRFLGVKVVAEAKI